MQRVLPIRVEPRASWMWPWRPSTGWNSSITSRTAFDPTGIVERPASLRSICSVSWGASSSFDAYGGDRKSTRLNSSHTEIYTLSLHDALPIFANRLRPDRDRRAACFLEIHLLRQLGRLVELRCIRRRSEEHTSELQSHRDLHSFPTRRSSDLREPPSTRPGSSSGLLP